MRTLEIHLEILKSKQYFRITWLIFKHITSYTEGSKTCKSRKPFLQISHTELP
jgi:hypothetical protein